LSKKRVAAGSSRGERRPKSEARLSIGALARATGIPVETLRTWESRYGFPLPERRPSGHRVYPVSTVPRLRRIAQALALGHRAGQVVAASDGALDQLLAAAATPALVPPAAAAPADVQGLVELVARFEADRLRQALVADWARLGPVEFLQTRVAPLLHAVGEAWASGELEVRHEHFVAEQVGDLLGSLRLTLEERTTGPLVVYATLPGERHGLGLQMAALVLAAAGCRGLYLGTDLPIAQLTQLVRDIAASAVAISISRASLGPASNALLRRLREALPRRVRLVAGGEGAPAGKGGIETVTSLRDLDSWGRRLALGMAPAPN
jgi:DNA-binding transcriptional MerR regulator/methylmalonyl-CoA mutase cobalamin-binding subunit